MHIFYLLSCVARCRFQTDKELISLKEKRTALSNSGWLYMLLKNGFAMRGARESPKSGLHQLLMRSEVCMLHKWLKSYGYRHGLWTMVRLSLR